MEALSSKRFALAAAATIFGSAAMPAHADSFTQWAPVVRTTPIYAHESDPQQQCWTERVTANEFVDRRGVPLGAVVGGITGGVVGSAAPSAGTVVSIGNAIDRDSAGIEVAPVTREVERCRVVDAGVDRLQGYDVTYRYHDREFTTRMAYDPGTRVQVRVDVTPGVQ